MRLNLKIRWQVYIDTGRLDKGYKYLNKLLKRSESNKDLIAISALNWSFKLVLSLVTTILKKLSSCAKIALYKVLILNGKIW